MDASTLFTNSPEQWDPPYRGEFDELAAIASSRKAISVFPFPQQSVLDNQEHYAALRSEATRLQLRWVETPPPEALASPVPHTYVFVLRSDAESWRISAYFATTQVGVDHGWSDGVELVQTFVLGYTADECRTWLAQNRYQRIGWSGRTVYCVLDAQQRDQVSNLRTAASTDLQLRLFYPIRSWLRRDASRLIPSGLTLARVAINRKRLPELFADASVDGDVVTTTRVIDANTLSDALESRIEFLGDSGWSV